MSAPTPDTTAVDRIALLLGTAPDWDGGADYLDAIAAIIGEVRPAVSDGDQAAGYAAAFTAATGRPADPTYVDDRTPLLGSYRWTVIASDAEPDSPPVADGTADSLDAGMRAGSTAAWAAVTASRLEVNDVDTMLDGGEYIATWSLGSDDLLLVLTVTPED